MMTPTCPKFPARVVILMAVHNGAAYLADQLQSLEEQSWRDWDLILSDDGSKDASLAIVETFARRWRTAPLPHQVTVLEGPSRGFVQNFFHLIRHVPESAEYVALCDQDDVWFTEKIARAENALRQVPDRLPVIYCAPSLICDARLRPMRVSPRFRRSPCFENALVQSIAGGNTMVLNRTAIDLVRKAVDEAGNVVSHDWWLYQLITACGGDIIRDSLPVLKYRQHAGNLIGSNTSLSARVKRLALVLDGRFSNWNRINLKALQNSCHRFTPEARRTLETFGQAMQAPLLSRISALSASGVHRQSPAGTFALYLACILKKL